MASGVQILKVSAKNDSIPMVGDNISGWTGSFVLGNITNVPVYFKIKSNAKGYCEASPSRAEIKPFEEVNIMVSYHKAASEDVILQLESIYKPCEGDTDLTSVWQREEFKLFWNIAETELRLKFTAEKMVAEELSEANVGMAKMLIAQYGELLRANLLPQAEIHMIRQRRGKWIGQIYLNNKTNATVNYRLKGTPATNAVFELPDPNYDVIPPRRLVPVTIVCREEKGAKCDLGRSPYAYRLEVVFPPLGDQNATHPSTIFKLPFFRCEENVTAMSIPIFFDGDQKAKLHDTFNGSDNGSVRAEVDR